MANDRALSAFMDLPLEVRHSIFQYVAARDVKPRKLLRYWFEKKEAKALVEQELAKNPSGPAPRVVYDNDYDDYDGHDDYDDDDDDESATAENDGEDDDEEENENVEEDSENEDGDGEGDEDSNEDGDGDETVEAEQEEDSDDENEADIDGEDAEEESEHTVNGAQIPQLATVQAAAQVDLDNQSTDEMEEDETEGALTNAGEENDNDSEGEEDDDNDDDEMAGSDGNTGAAVATTQPPPAPVVVRPHGKWRHIPNFMRLTQCPPPVQLLLTSQQLNHEAKNWFYDVAILRIDATGSFAHTCFFETAFSQITDAAFSPMENIRKVDVTFVWDSTWIRADTSGCVQAVFPALLRQRSSFVYQILLQAPDLREVVIHWHDSAQDDESTNLMLDNLAPFRTLPATVEIIEHYIAADATPRKRSIAGKRRVEFQNILDMGLDRLF